MQLNAGGNGGGIIQSSRLGSGRLGVFVKRTGRRIENRLKESGQGRDVSKLGEPEAGFAGATFGDIGAEAVRRSDRRIGGSAKIGSGGNAGRVARIG